MTGKSPVYDSVEYHRRVLDIARNVVRDDAEVPIIAPHSDGEAGESRDVDSKPAGPARGTAPAGRAT